VSVVIRHLFCFSFRRRARRAPHVKLSFILAHDFKTEPLVETLCRVAFEHLERDGQCVGVGGAQHRAERSFADAAPLQRGRDLQLND